MKQERFSTWLSVFVFLSGCASFNVASDIQAGRQALLVNNPEVALSHFQRAVQVDPNYTASYGVFQEGAWTYVGRAHYAAGRLPEARAALERALSQDPNDSLARLYLGLVLARSGDTKGGAAEIDKGLSALHNWFEHISANTFYGQFWDPRREIRSEIQTARAMVSSNNVDWLRLIANGDWIGTKVEEEIDLGRRDETKDIINNLTDS